jgi:hypothetical protein
MYVFFEHDKKNIILVKSCSREPTCDHEIYCAMGFFFLLSGCGDFTLVSVSSLPDPCPLPDKLKKRSLNEKEKLIYAPMTGVGGIVYDKVTIFYR